jgi:hypothetical protein
VPAALTFEALHEVIQAAMGWQNYHLYDFEVGTSRLGVPDPEFGDDRSEDARRVRLRDAGLAEGRTLLYRYDFGDGWEHDLIVEQVLEAPREAPVRARCLEGARACPPEDCGGPYGYAELLEVLADPDHPDHKELGDWAGADFDPERFDAAMVDAALNRA